MMICSIPTGSWMFHNFVPWDDDADMWLPYADLPKWKKYFSKAEHRNTHDVTAWGYTCGKLDEMDLDVLQAFPANASDTAYYKRTYSDLKEAKEPCHKFKFFNKTSVRPWPQYKWTYPYLDLIFYHENKTHIWDHNYDGMMIPRERFYPLILRPFGNVELSAPADTQYVLHQRFKNFNCKEGTWNHREEKWILKRRSANCSDLYDTYPQVWTKPLSNGSVEESLKIAGKTIKSVVFKGPNFSKMKSKRPYDL